MATHVAIGRPKHRFSLTLSHGKITPGSGRMVGTITHRRQLAFSLCYGCVSTSTGGDAPTPREPVPSDPCPQPLVAAKG